MTSARWSRRTVPGTLALLACLASAPLAAETEVTEAGTPGAIVEQQSARTRCAPRG